MQGNRKARRKLAKLAKKGDKYIEQLAVNAVGREIEESAETIVDDKLAIATDYTISAMILAIDRAYGWEREKYEPVLDGFRDIFSELLLSGDAESYMSMAENVCGHELHLEFEHD